MVLKGLTCSHMIVMMYGEGETGKQGGNTTKQKQKAGFSLWFDSSDITLSSK